MNSVFYWISILMAWEFLSSLLTLWEHIFTFPVLSHCVNPYKRKKAFAWKTLNWNARQYKNINKTYNFPAKHLQKSYFHLNLPIQYRYTRMFSLYYMILLEYRGEATNGFLLSMYVYRHMTVMCCQISLPASYCYSYK